MAQDVGGQSGSAGQGDWPAQAADTVERLVSLARDKAVGPAIMVARAIVFGLLAAIVGLAALVVFCILAVRLLDIIPGVRIWLADMILGIIFGLVGLMLWSKRRATEGS